MKRSIPDETISPEESAPMKYCPDSEKYPHDWGVATDSASFMAHDSQGIECKAYCMFVSTHSD